jgi:uncharacterized protein involved in exopolysaccharide biosynthesis
VYEEFAQQVGRISERAGVQVPDAVLVAGAPTPLAPVSPNRPLILLLSLLAGLIVGTAWAVLLAVRSGRSPTVLPGDAGRVKAAA